jgi:hypothetical protein
MEIVVTTHLLQPYAAAAKVVALRLCAAACRRHDAKTVNQLPSLHEQLYIVVSAAVTESMKLLANSCRSPHDLFTLVLKLVVIMEVPSLYAACRKKK